MLVCLRSAQFQYADHSGSIVVDLRRHHDTVAECANKEFLVMKRLTRLPHVLITKAFGTYQEAARYWDKEVGKIADTGLARRDLPIVGWHEEG